MRRPVAVEPRDDGALLVEEQQRRRELHVERARERLLAHRPPVDPGRLAVAPDVERDRDEMAARLVDDRALREVGDHQLPAVRAAVLAEVDHHPAAVLRRVGDVLAEIEERLGEPRRNVDRVGRRILRARAGRDAQHAPAPAASEPRRRSHARHRAYPASKDDAAAIRHLPPDRGERRRRRARRGERNQRPSSRAMCAA